MRKDGGPAFPNPYIEADPLEKGMSLRDWFAGQALVGMLAATCEYGFLNDDYVAKKTKAAGESAYRLADAMLLARANQEPSP